MTPEQQARMADKVTLIDEIAQRARVLPVIVINDEREILPMADALAAGGLTCLEVTLRSKFGLKAIELLRQQRPNLTVGAGTVLDRHMFAAVEAAGAQFVVTPGATQDMLEAGVESALPLLPGIATASEIMMGYALGYRRFKLFPAEICGGAAAIQAFGGPFGDVRFCPTGGVNVGNLKAYMSLPNVMCVGGTWMLNKAWIKAEEWDKVEQSSREAVALF